MDEFVSLNNYDSWFQMTGQYAQETKLLIEDAMGLGQVDEPHIEQKLRLFCLDPTVQELFQEVHRQYPDMKVEEEALYVAFQQVKEADPGFCIPHIYTQISILNQSIVVGDSVLGISLDKYLGADYPLYRQYYSDYQCATMTRSRIVPEAVFFYLMAEYPLLEEGEKSLIRCACHVGKMHCLVARLLNISLEEELPFDVNTIHWFRENEQDIARWIGANNYWRDTHVEVISLLLEPSPSTPLYARNAPGQLGVWMGCSIMEKYLEAHPDLSIRELLELKDYDALLQESGFDK
ncbi:MAG: hypothetical protein NC388_03715 [Clostridium sp.]|nr:hypothetical protein [Clostridium sp.]